MSSAGRAANSNGCVSKPKEHATGLIGFAAQIRRSSLIGSCAMETAEHREPCESRGSRTDLGAPGGEIPPGDSTLATFRCSAMTCRMHDFKQHTAEAMPELFRQLKAGGYKVVHMEPKGEVTTVPKYDEMLAHEDKLSSNNTRPESSVIRTIGE